MNPFAIRRMVRRPLKATAKLIQFDQTFALVTSILGLWGWIRNAYSCNFERSSETLQRQ